MINRAKFRHSLPDKIIVTLTLNNIDFQVFIIIKVLEYLAFFIKLNHMFYLWEDWIESAWKSEILYCKDFSDNFNKIVLKVLLHWLIIL